MNTDEEKLLHSIPPEEWSLAHIKAYHEAWVREGSEENRRTASERELEIWERIIEARDKGQVRPSGFKLDWEDLNLSEITGTLSALGDALVRLDLTANRIEVLPDRIGDLRALRVLYLSGNRITTLPDRIGDLQALRNLDLTDNDLHRLPAGMRRLGRDVRVALRGNPIASGLTNMGDWKDLLDVSKDITQMGAVQTAMEDRALAAPLDSTAAAWLQLDMRDRAAILKQLEGIDRRYWTAVDNAQAILKATSADDERTYAEARKDLVLATGDFNRMRNFSRV